LASTTEAHLAPAVNLREVLSSDLPLFFTFQLDHEANFMAAFTAKDPTDRVHFDAHWQKILANKTIPIRTILVDGQVVGSVLSYVDEGQREVSYWLGKQFWGRGYASRALALYLEEIGERPLYARAAKDNAGSLRVLAKNGFVVIGESSGFAEARGMEVAEYLLRLD
jgi:RimJ/RimL family protein N-acetyltransferase